MFRSARISVALVLLASQSSVTAAPVGGKAKDAALLHIEPELKDVKGDKKFFGPPFPADYPDDTRPVVDKKILGKVKGPGQPYPTLQTSKHFDKDYIKDENADTGAWKAQFEYDALRKKLTQEEGDVKNAKAKSDEEAKDADKSKKDADAAAKEAADAQKEADAAAAEKEEAKAGEEKAPSADSLEELKKNLKVAEDNYAKEKIQFEQCKKELEEAKALVERLQAQQTAMEEKLNQDTKLWAENQNIKLNAKKAKEAEIAGKRKVVSDKVKAAKQRKTELDAKFAREKSEADYAKQQYEKKQAELQKTKDDLEKAALRIKQLRGEVPAGHQDVKSSAASYAMWPLLATAALRALL